MRRMKSALQQPAQSEFEEDFIEGVREILLSRDLKQEDLAELMGTTQGNVSKMLDGSGLTTRTMRRIAAALQIKVRILISEQ